MGDSSQPGVWNALTDVEGISVGQFERLDPPWRTGATVIVFDRPSVAAVDVRGGGPGTRDTDVLRAGNANQRIDAVALAGSSAYGLDAAGGVMRAMQRLGRGLSVGVGAFDVVPIVPGAIIFDLGRGGSSLATVDGTFGEAAFEAASNRAISQGSRGAGAGARCGGLAAGVGTASAVSAKGHVVAALVVANSFGSAFDPETRLPWGMEFELDGEFDDYRRRRDPNFVVPPRAEISKLNTVVGVVASNVVMNASECKRLATIAHDGLARAVRPAHTFFDGDTFFGVSTGRQDAENSAGIGRNLELSELFELGAQAVSRAIVHAVGSASGAPDAPSWCLVDARS